MGRVSQVIADMEHCYECGSPNVQVHHIFHGFARKAADRFGYVAPLCMTCHAMIHDGGNKELDLRLKQLAQWHYEEHIGSRAEFIETFGRSYL